MPNVKRRCVLPNMNHQLNVINQKTFKKFHAIIQFRMFGRFVDKCIGEATDDIIINMFHFRVIFIAGERYATQHRNTDPQTHINNTKD